MILKGLPHVTVCDLVDGSRGSGKKADPGSAPKRGEGRKEVDNRGPSGQELSHGGGLPNLRVRTPSFQPLLLICCHSPSLDHSLSRRGPAS